MRVAEITETTLETFTAEDFEYDALVTAEQHSIGFIKTGQG